MEASILRSSSLSLPPLQPHSYPFSVKFLPLHQMNNIIGLKPSHNIKVSASRRGDYDGRMIDQNMVVLRKRIQEMKMKEMQCEDEEVASEWMEWEKKYYQAYNSDVCEAVGSLQLALMNTRPSLALGMFALFMLSVPTSFVIIMLHLWGWINGLQYVTFK